MYSNFVNNGLNQIFALFQPVLYLLTKEQSFESKIKKYTFIGILKRF